MLKKEIVAWYIKRNFEGSNYGPSLVGPFYSKQEAEEAAKPFVNRKGWTVEIISRIESEQYRDFV
jgi:hypothetical protein